MVARLRQLVTVSLETGFFEGSEAGTATILPVIRRFQDRHGIGNMVVVAGSGMLPAGNLGDLNDTGLGSITSSRTMKAPTGLEPHFCWFSVPGGSSVCRRHGFPRGCCVS